MTEAGERALLLIEAHMKECERRQAMLMETIRDNRAAAMARDDRTSQKFDALGKELHDRISSVKDDIQSTVRSAGFYIIGALVALVGGILAAWQPWMAHQ